MSDICSCTAPRRRRVQFTIRTFFGAAVLVSCFGVALQLPGEAPKAMAITFLIWLTFAGLYWICGGIGPLVTLPVATVVGGVLLGVTLPLVDIGAFEGMWVVVPMGLMWGVFFSLLVALSRGLRRLVTPRKELPVDPEADRVIRPAAYVRYVLFTRLLFAVLLLAAACVLAPYSSEALVVPLLISLYLDVPVVPPFLGIFDSMGPGSSSYEIIGFMVVTSVVAFPLHGVTSWIVGRLVARIERNSLPSELASEGEGRGGEEASIVPSFTGTGSSEPQNTEQGTAEG